ncbi:uncharacterized protein V6R79_018129 [Siganus canaliculatus]
MTSAVSGLVAFLLYLPVYLLPATQAQCTGSSTSSPGHTGNPHLQVNVRTGYVFHPYWAKMKCHSSCHLASGLSFIWYKNGQNVTEGQHEYSGNFDESDSISCAVKGLEDFPSPSVCVLSQSCNRVSYIHSHICAFKGSSVDISSTYGSHGPIASKLWFIPGRGLQWQSPSQGPHTESQYGGRVQVLDPGSGRSTLRISDLRQSDSAQYRFRFKAGSFEWKSSLPGTTLTVTALEVQATSVTIYGSYTEAELKCHSSCSPEGHFSYVWFKNGQNVMEKISYKDNFYSQDSVYCAFKGPENYTSPLIYPSKLSAVSVSPSGEIVEGNSVTLTCRADGNALEKNYWYKDNEARPLGLRGVYYFSSIRSVDKGNYHCRTGNQHFKSLFLNVQYGPKPPSVSVSPSGEIVEGSSLTLTCSSDANPAANYTWYKENGNLNPVRTGPQLVLSSIQSPDSGQYYCRAENKLGRRTSEHTSIQVRYAPRPPSVSVSPSGEIVEGSSVTLTCSSDANPASKYTWYKKNGNLNPVRTEPQLVFSSIQSSDSGQYYCRAENKLGRRTSEHTSIHVKYGPKPPSVSVSPSGEIVEGSSVTLTCSSDAVPAAKYTWYKKNGTLNPVRTGPQLVFSSIQSSDSGQYDCRAENKLGRRTSEHTSIHVKYAPKPPSVSVTSSGEIVEGSSVTLTCSSDANPAAKYTWYKENQQVLQGPTGVYGFISISSEDRGVYYCQADNQYGRVNSSSLLIDVQYAPKPPSVSVSPSGEIVEGSSVTLTCSTDANPAAKYTWYKENGTLNPVRTEPQLVFSSIQSSDSGQYYCRAENKLGRRTSEHTSIHVKYAPRPPSVSVSPSGEIVEGSSLTLTCSSDANPAAKYTWYKENQQVLQGPTGVYGFMSISSEDRGVYYCQADNQYGRVNSSSLLIDVQYAPKPPSVSVSPSGEIVEGSSVTLTCSTDANPAAKYTWYKENGTLNPVRTEPQLVFSSIQSSDSGQYYCRAENKLGRRTSEHTSIHVKYAPRPPSVSVSPSGEIVEGSSLTLTCSSDANPAAKYTWYKENQQVLQGPTGVYGFMSISSEDRGVYYCQADNQYGRVNSSSLLIDVQYAPKPPSVTVSPSCEIVEGSSVTLTCSSDANPAANYTWYKENEDSPKASGQTFTITDFRAEHRGNYSCEAQNKRGRAHSTVQQVVVADTSMRMIINIIRLSLVAVIPIPLLLFHLWIRKRSFHPK